MELVIMRGISDWGLLVRNKKNWSRVMVPLFDVQA